MFETTLLFGSWFKWESDFSSLNPGFLIWKKNDDTKTYIIGNSCKFSGMLMDTQ